VNLKRAEVAARPEGVAPAARPGGVDAAARPDLVRACFGEPVRRTPVWFMRQAGRSLPEYRAARGEGSILAAVADAALSAELTLQPVRRYGVDAAIVFSDIVVPLHAIGFGVEVEAGRGPVVAEPFRRPEDLTRLRPLEPEVDVPYVAETIRLVRRELDGSGVAVIGFAGAPFTIASYLVEGGPSRTFAKVKALMHGDPVLWRQLTERLAAVSLASVRAQVAAGAQVIQLFDSWIGSLSPDEYARFALPSTRAVLSGLGELGVPTILFGVGTGELLGLMATSGANVIGVDWRVPLDQARRRVGPHCALQGNLDPALCLAPWPVVAGATRGVLAAAGRAGANAGPGAVTGAGAGSGATRAHVFNLGHGVLPESDPGILAAVVELVHAETSDRARADVADVEEASP
jgi:uroporphyrinogen decarboxylase